MGAFMNGELRAMKACYEAGARVARESKKSAEVEVEGAVPGDGAVALAPIRVVRPLIYAREAEMRAFAALAGLPVITENCPACFEAPKERRRVKKVLAQQESLFPATFNHLRRALTPLMAADATRTLQAFSAERRATETAWNWGDSKEAPARGAE